MYFSDETVHDDFEDIVNIKWFSRKDWIYLVEVSTTQTSEESSVVDEHIGFSVTENSLKMK